MSVFVEFDKRLREVCEHWGREIESLHTIFPNDLFKLIISYHGYFDILLLYTTRLECADLAAVYYSKNANPIKNFKKICDIPIKLQPRCSIASRPQNNQAVFLGGFHMKQHEVMDYSVMVDLNTGFFIFFFVFPNF